MRALRYDEDLLSKLQLGTGVWVKNLCKKPDSEHAALAHTIERWFIELRCKKRLLTRLTSAKDTEFMAALWELAAARLFYNAGFKIVWEPKVEQTIPGSSRKTPEFRATRGDIEPLVEVLNLNPSEYERLEDERRDRLARDLQTRLSLKGNLTLALKQGFVLDPYPRVSSLITLLQPLRTGGILATRTPYASTTIQFDFTEPGRQAMSLT
jgi:hypothetical protein